MARPAQEVRLALLAAARELFRPERAPTMAELRNHAKVGTEAARRTIENMSRSGALCKVRERPVSYRNKPVAEYAPPDLLNEAGGHVELAAAMSTWAS